MKMNKKLVLLVAAFVFTLAANANSVQPVSTNTVVIPANYATGGQVTVEENYVKPATSLQVENNVQQHNEADTTTLEDVQNGIKTTTDMINTVDTSVKKLNSIKSGLRDLGF